MADRIGQDNVMRGGIERLSRPEKPAGERFFEERAAGSPGAMQDQDRVDYSAARIVLEMHIKYERGVANKGNPSDTKFYSARNPNFYQISRQEQVLDILRNVTTTPPDRVKEFSFKASGATYAKLFDGTEKVLSWDNILWINRAVLLP